MLEKEDGYLRDGEEDVDAPFDVAESRSRDDNANEVCRPVRRSRHGIRRSTDPQGNDLDLVEPGHALPANGVESAEDVDESRASVQ